MGTQSHQVAGVNLCHGTEFKDTVTALAWDLPQGPVLFRGFFANPALDTHNLAWAF